MPAKLPKGGITDFYFFYPCSIPFFRKPFLPHSTHILLLEPSIIIPCLPWPQGWEQYVQDRPLKFLPQGLLIWSTSRGLAFGSQTWGRYEYKLLMPSSLPLGKSLSVLGENEVNTQTYADQKSERGREEDRKSFGAPVMPNDSWTSLLYELIKHPFYLS